MEIKEIIEESVEKIKDMDSVHSIILFGSVAKEEEREGSDIDLCKIGRAHV